MSITFRPVRPDDRAALLALCDRIWGDHDYIPGVWDDWLADPSGQFTAVVDTGAGDRVIGMGKLTLVTAPGEWWLEGLRLDPAYQGRGIGRQLHEYNVGLWRRGGPGVLRLITDFDNKPVQHLCAQTGFRLLADVTVFEAEAAVAGPSLPFRPLAPSEADPAFAVAARAHLYRAFERLFCFDHVWKWAELTPQWLARCALGGQAWWWGGARGVIVGDPAPEGDTPLDNLSCLFVCFAGADPDALADLLVDLRSLAGALDKPRVGIPVPLGDPIAQAALDRAGYRRAWTGSLHLYEARQ